MMECATMREWILEVDPDELEPKASGGRSNTSGEHREITDEHAEHLADCPRCRALADEILRAEAALGNTLGSVEPALDVEAALARAREAYEAQEARPRYRHWRVALPLTAAAALGGLLLLNRPAPVSNPRFDPATVAAARALGLAGARPLVSAASYERVAVLPTDNPNITIIWFME